MDAYAARVVAALDEIDVPRAVVCGLSLGGYVALAIARVARSRVAGLILADTRSGADTDSARAERERMLRLIDRGGPAAVADDMIPKLLGPSTLTSRVDIVDRVGELIRSQTAGALADATRAMMTRQDSTPLLASLDVPALVIVGEDDTLTPPAEAEAMASALAQATLLRIPAAGHLSNLENPGAFNVAVGHFLSAM